MDAFIDELSKAGFVKISAQQWKNQLIHELNKNDLKVEEHHSPFYTKGDIKTNNLTKEIHHFYCHEHERNFKTGIQLSPNWKGDIVSEARLIKSLGNDIIIFPLSFLLAKCPHESLSFNYLSNSIIVINIDIDNLSTIAIPEFTNWIIRQLAGSENITISLSTTFENLGDLKILKNEIEKKGVRVNIILNFDDLEIKEIIRQFININHSPELNVEITGVTIRMGINYFNEIAKVRSLKFLLNKLNMIFREPSQPVQLWGMIDINGKSSAMHDEVLKATTSLLSATIGGADSVVIYCDDFPPSDPNYSNSLFYIIGSILKEESLISEVNDAVSGSYFLEVSTENMIRQSWEAYRIMND